MTTQTRRATCVNRMAVSDREQIVWRVNEKRLTERDELVSRPPADEQCRRQTLIIYVKFDDY